MALGGQRRPGGLKQPPMDGDVSERDYLTWLSGRLAGITRYDLSDDDRDAIREAGLCWATPRLRTGRAMMRR